MVKTRKMHCSKSVPKFNSTAKVQSKKKTKSKNNFNVNEELLKLCRPFTVRLNRCESYHTLMKDVGGKIYEWNRQFYSINVDFKLKFDFFTATQSIPSKIATNSSLPLSESIADCKLLAGAQTKLRSSSRAKIVCPATTKDLCLVDKGKFFKVLIT